MIGDRKSAHTVFNILGEKILCGDYGKISDELIRQYIEDQEKHHHDDNFNVEEWVVGHKRS